MGEDGVGSVSLCPQKLVKCKQGGKKEQYKDYIDDSKCFCSREWSLLNCVPYVLPCPTCLMFHVPCALRVLVLQVPCVLRALINHYDLLIYFNLTTLIHQPAFIRKPFIMRHFLNAAQMHLL